MSGFAPGSMKRITSTVLRWERFAKNSPPPRRGRRGHPPITVRQGIVTESTGSPPGIPVGGSGDVLVYIDGTATTETITGYNDWIGLSSTVGIANGLHVYVIRFRDDNKWRILAADCDPEIEPAAPGHGNDINLTTEATGTIQDTAHTLSFNANRITTATATDNAVKPSTSFGQGDDIVVRNDDAADAVQFFPEVDSYINNLAKDAAISIAANTGLFLRKVEADHWVSI